MHGAVRAAAARADVAAIKFRSVATLPSRFTIIVTRDGSTPRAKWGRLMGADVPALHGPLVNHSRLTEAG